MTAIVKYDKPELDTVGAAEQRAALVVIDDQTTYEMATELARTFKSRGDAIEAKRAQYVKPLNDLKAVIQADFVPVIEDYAAGVRLIKGKMAEYVAIEQRKQREAQAEADRVAREAAAAAEKAAKAAEKKGNVEVAEAIREIAAVSSPVFVAPTVTQSAGTSLRDKWTAEVVDFLALVQYVAAHPEYIGLLEANPSAVRKLAELLREKMNIPGLKAVKSSVVALRT